MNNRDLTTKNNSLSIFRTTTPTNEDRNKLNSTKLINHLYKVFPKPEGLTSTRCLSDIFPNDRNPSTVIEELQKMQDPNSCKDNNATKVAIIIGNGYLLSLLPHIQADVILFCDIDAMLLNWMEYLVKSYKERYREDDFINHLLENPIYPADWSGYITREYIREIRALGKYHYFDKDNYWQCKNAVNSKLFGFINIDFSNTEQMQQFGAILKENNAQITFMNLTNLGSWQQRNIQNYYDCLAKLTYSEYTRILYSSSLYSDPGETPHCNPVCNSLNDYCKNLLLDLIIDNLNNDSLKDNRELMRNNINILSGNKNYHLLHFCIIKNEIRDIKLLLEFFTDIDIHIKNNNGESPLDFARKLGKQEIVELLEKYESTKETVHNNGELICRKFSP